MTYRLRTQYQNPRAIEWINVPSLDRARILAEQKRTCGAVSIHRSLDGVTWEVVEP